LRSFEVNSKWFSDWTKGRLEWIWSGKGNTWSIMWHLWNNEILFQTSSRCAPVRNVQSVRHTHSKWTSKRQLKNHKYILERILKVLTDKNTRTVFFRSPSIFSPLVENRPLSFIFLTYQWPVLRLVRTQAILFLTSMSERGGFPSVRIGPRISICFGPSPVRDLEFFLGPGPVPGFENSLVLVRGQPVSVRGSLVPPLIWTSKLGQGWTLFPKTINVLRKVKKSSTFR